MGVDGAVNSYTGLFLSPYAKPETAIVENVNLPVSVTYARGQLLAQVSAAVTDVQTLTITGTPTGGSVVVTITLLSGGVTTVTIPYNSTVSATQTLVNAAVGSGVLTVGGGTLPGSTQTFTGAGVWASIPLPLMTVSSSLTGGSSPTASIAHTTQGVSAGTYTAYSSTVVTAPTTAPTVAGNGSGSSYGAGTYAVSYTFKNANGETTPSPVTNVTVTAAQNLRITAFAAATGATGANFYVNGTYAGTAAVSGGNIPQTDLTGASITVGATPPLTNTAFTGATNVWKPVAILKYDVTTDATGCAVYSSTSGASSQLGGKVFAVEAYIRGIFKISELTGWDTNAATYFRTTMGGVAAALGV